MKHCSQCKVIKPLEEFHRDKNKKDGHHSACVKCASIKNSARYRSKEGLISAIYNSQVQTSKKRNHSAPLYSREELKVWLLAQSNFELLYQGWVSSNYNRWARPSCDRIDDSIGYSFSNIQLMTWEKNDAKRDAQVRSGKANHIGHPQQKVLQMDLNGIPIKEHVSIMEAMRSTGISNGNISMVCHGHRKTAGGFKWVKL